MEQHREEQPTTTGPAVGATGGPTGAPTGRTGGPGESTGAGTSSGFGGAADDIGTADSYDRTFAEKEPGVKERVGDSLDEGRAHIGEAVHTGKNRLADRIQRVGDRLHERARHMEESGGVQGRAGHVALRASESIDRSADYIRSHEVDDMRDDLENAIRQRPLLSIGIAAGAGFLLARLLRD